MTISISPLIPSPTHSNTFIRINCPLIADAHQFCAPASLVLKSTEKTWQIHALDHPHQIDTLPLPSSTKTIDLPDQIIIPALINAHTHLDLTHIGPQPHDPAAGFVPWVDMIRANRLSDPTEITASVNLGIQKSINGGTIAVGDIAGAPQGHLTNAPIHALAKSPLLGTSYLEFFGIGKTQPTVIDRLDHYIKNILPKLLTDLQGTGVQLGFSPHATNTVAIAVYQWIVSQAKKINPDHPLPPLPICTHLAETLEERQFIATAQGPQRELLERFNIWNDAILQTLGQNKHPVEHLKPILNQTKILCAHVNDASDQAIETLAQTQTPIAYCPRASNYFANHTHLGKHRYQDMLAAGINVSLGTDSIVNLDTPDRITTLDDMRFLHARDNTDMQTLLKMTTTNPARALGLNPNNFTLTKNTTPAALLLLDTTKPRSTGIQPVSSSSPGLPGEVPEGRRGSSSDPSPNPWHSAMQSKTPPTWLLFQPKL